MKILVLFVLIAIIGAIFNKKYIKNIICNAVLSIVIVGIIYYLFYFEIVIYFYFVTEDYWAEYATFVCFGLASCFMGCAIILEKKLLNPWYILMAFALFFVSLEEISWGQRLFNMETPDLFKQYNYQGEANFHNVIAWDINYHKYICHATLIWSILIPTITSKVKKSREIVDNLGFPFIPICLCPFFCIASFFIIKHPLNTEMDNEVGPELLLGFAFAAFAFNTLIRVSKKHIKVRIPQFILTILLIIATMGISSLFVWYRPGIISESINRMAIILSQESRLYKQADLLYAYILENPSTMTNDSFFQYGKFLKRIRNDEKAKIILKRALKDQQIFMLENPNDPRLNLVSGQVLKLLSQDYQAMTEFQKAIEKSNSQLRNTENHDERARIFATIGEVHFEMEDYESAIIFFNMAYGLTSEKFYQIYIGQWKDESMERLNKLKQKQLLN